MIAVVVAIAYLPAGQQQRITTFVVEPASGAWRRLSSSRALAASATLSPSGPFLYVGHYSGGYGSRRRGYVSAYAIEPTSGSLSALTLFEVGQVSEAIVFAPPAGRFLYVADGEEYDWTHVLPMDDLSGARGDARVDTVGPRKVATHPSGGFAYLVHRFTPTLVGYRLDARDGSVAEIGRVAGIIDAVVDPAGRFLYALKEDAVVVLRIRADGTFAAVGSAPAEPQPNRLTIDPSGRYVCVSSGDPRYDPRGGTLSAYRADPETGALEPLSRFAERSARYLAFEPQGRFLYAAGDLGVLAYRLDDGTGTLSSVGSVAADGGGWIGFVSLAAH